MAEQQKMTPAEKFDTANRNFKTVYRDRKRQHWKKYMFLHNWTLKKSEYLLADEKAYSGNKKVYRRGAIVNVDFGVNVGTELSGNHFAIVLNKDDAPANDKLTVIPLTSHKHPHTVKLTHTIRESGLQFLINKQLDFIALTAALLYFREGLYKQLGTTDAQNVESYHTFLEKVHVRLPGEAAIGFQKVENFVETTLATEESAKALVASVSKEIPGNSDPLSTEFLQNAKQASEDFTFVLSKYRGYNRVTYAKVLDITTISKARLRKINHYDPIGEIIADSSTIDEIDNELKALFTKNESPDPNKKD